MLFSGCKIYNYQTDGVFEEILVKHENKTFQIHPVAYFWLEKQNKLSLVDKVWNPFNIEFYRVLNSFDVETIKPNYIEKYDHFYKNFMIDDMNIQYIKSLSLLMEYLLSDENLSIEEKINYSIDYNLEPNNEYMDLIQKVVSFHKVEIAK